MQFVTNGPDIPDELLQAHEEGRVVFFCGAGISYPAGLPGFKGLVELISDVTDEDIQVYLEKVHGFKGELSTFTTHELGFKANHHPYYITSEEKNKIKVI